MTQQQTTPQTNSVYILEGYFDNASKIRAYITTHSRVIATHKQAAKTVEQFIAVLVFDYYTWLYRGQM